MENEDAPITSVNSSKTYGSGEISHYIGPQLLPTEIPEKKLSVYRIHGNPISCLTTSVEKSDSIDGKESVTIVDEYFEPNRERIANEVKAIRKLLLASTLCLIFMIAELTGAYLSNSLAIASDATHLLTDFLTFMKAICPIWVALKPFTRSGWYWVAVIGAFTSALLIWAIAGELFYTAVGRLTDMTFEVDANVMVVTSVFGFLANIILCLTLHQRSDGSYDFSVWGNKINTVVIRAYLHVLGDVILKSLGLLSAAVALYIMPDCKIIDPICTIVFSILVLFNTRNMVRDVLVVLTEGMPQRIAPVTYVDLKEKFMTVEGIKHIDSLRVWTLSPDKIAVYAQLSVEPGVNIIALLKEVSQEMYKIYFFFDCTFQVDTFES